MQATVHVQLQLRIVGDDGTVLTDCKILGVEKSNERLEALGLSLSEFQNPAGALAAAYRHSPSGCLRQSASLVCYLRPPAVQQGKVPDRLSYRVRQCRPLQPALSPLWLPPGRQQDIQPAG